MQRAQKRQSGEISEVTQGASSEKKDWGQVLADNLNRNAVKEHEEEIKSGFRDKDGNVIIRQAEVE